MCGIAGSVGGAGGPPERARVALATAALAHRGPDDEGLWVAPSGRACLGHRRLSIIDLAHGQQPLASEDGAIQLVLNGEIYNHRELRADLERRGHRFRTGSDAEPLVHLYEEEGERAIAKLRGMFAFAPGDER